MSTPTYIATVYGVAVTARACASMREAFEWVKTEVQADPDAERGTVHLGDDLLCHFDRRTTLWFHDGYTRWEHDR